MQYEIRAMSLGEILDTGFRIVRNHFAILLSLAVVIYGPLSLFNAYFQSLAKTGPAMNPDEAMAMVSVVITVVVIFAITMLIAWPVLFAAITFALGELYQGRPATFRPCVRKGFSLFLPLIGTSFLYWIVTFSPMFGVGLLAAPLTFAQDPVGPVVGLLIASAFLVAFFFSIRLAVAHMLVWPIVVLEDQFGLTALRRSRNLMQGHLLRGIAVGLVGAVITLVLTWSIQLATDFIPIVNVIAYAVAQSAGLSFTTAIAVVFYFDIRCRKEAFDLAHLAEQVESAGATGAPATPL